MKSTQKFEDRVQNQKNVFKNQNNMSFLWQAKDKKQNKNQRKRLKDESREAM